MAYLQKQLVVVAGEDDILLLKLLQASFQIIVNPSNNDDL